MSLPAGAHRWTVPRRVWRLGFAPDPWLWADWKWALGGVFTGRFDDTDGHFRTLYVASTPLAALVEALAPLRVDPVMAAGMARVRGASGPGRAGVVTADWRLGKRFGSAELVGALWPVTSSTALMRLRGDFHGVAVSAGAATVDAPALKDGRYRALTQAIATWVYGVYPALTGLQYLSRHGDDLECIALFERTLNKPLSEVRGAHSVPLSPWNPDLLRAASLLGVRIQV